MKERDIDSFIAEEKQYGFTVSREQAIRYMAQREANVRYSPPPRAPNTYEDAYGTLRWTDSGDRVQGGQR